MSFMAMPVCQLPAWPFSGLSELQTDIPAFCLYGQGDVGTYMCKFTRVEGA